MALTQTTEHSIHQRTWLAVILVLGGMLLASRAPVPMTFIYFLLFFGHAGMINIIWCAIDMLGMVRWWGQ